MKKFSFILLTLAASSLLAAPQAVVFDWGNVIGFDHRSVVVDFICDSFHFSEEEFELANLEKRKAVKSGKTDVIFGLRLLANETLNCSGIGLSNIQQS